MLAAGKPVPREFDVLNGMHAAGYAIFHKEPNFMFTRDFDIDDSIEYSLIKVDGLISTAP